MTTRFPNRSGRNWQKFIVRPTRAAGSIHAVQRVRVRVLLRWTFNVAAAVSLALCAATAVLGIRTRDRNDMFTTTAGPRFFELALRPREVSLSWVSQLPPSSVPPGQSLGWSVGIGRRVSPSGAAYLNVPQQLMRTSSFAGVSVT